MKHIIRISIFVSILSCTAVLHAETPTEQETDIKTLKEFPLRRLNYMYSRFIVPTIFSNSGGTFVSGVMGEYYPAGTEEEYSFGVRTMQGYGAKTGMTQSLVFDSYKSYSFARPERFEINSAFGLGFNSPYIGAHLGLFGQFAINDYKAEKENDILGPTGPVEPNHSLGKKKIGLNGSWFGYYKVLNFIYLKSVFKEYTKDFTSKENTSLLGVGLGEFLNMDYFRNMGALIGDLRLSSFTLRRSGSYRSKELDFDFGVRGGYNEKIKKFNEYAFSGELSIMETFTAGVEYNKSYFVKSHFGFTAGFFLWMDNKDKGGGYLKVFYFKSYSPYVLQYSAEQGLLLECRLFFDGGM